MVAAQEMAPALALRQAPAPARSAREMAMMGAEPEPFCDMCDDRRQTGGHPCVGCSDREEHQVNRRAAVLSGATVAAVALANVLSARYGPAVSVLNALWLIGLAIVTRDALHDLWQGRALALRMGALIAAGAAVSYGIAISLSTAPAEIAAKIALGSCLAFAAAETVDALAYHGLRGRPWWQRSNGSNLPAAFVDSLVFAWIAFGDPLGVGTAQLLAKVVGGLAWSYALRPRGEGWRGSAGDEGAPAGA